MRILYILPVASDERDEIEAFTSFPAIDMTGRKNLRAILYFTALYFGNAEGYCVCRFLKNYKSYHFVLCKHTKVYKVGCYKQMQLGNYLCAH